MTPSWLSFWPCPTLLTGVENLDPTVGSIYLRSLQESSEFEVAVTRLLEAVKAGRLQALPTTLEELESNDISTIKSTRRLTEQN